MLNDYECPRCHNIFPSNNKFLHDMKCTASKPFPLNASRMVFENRENLFPRNNNIINNQINISSSINFPNVFYCEICHESILEKDKNDHMLCHNLENEENNRINDNENDYDNMEEEEINENYNVRIRQNQNRNNNNYQLNININPLNNNNQNIRINNLSRRTNRRNNNNNIFQSNNNRNNNRNNNQGYRYISSIRNRAQRNNNNNRNHRIYANVQYNNYANDDDDGEVDDEFEGEELDDEFEEYEEFEGDFSDEYDNYQNPIEQNILDNLPETKIEDINKLDPEKKNCVICLEDFRNGENVINLPCIHLFHKNCINDWLKNQNSCPICKFKLTQENMNS